MHSEIFFVQWSNFWGTSNNLANDFWAWDHPAIISVENFRDRCLMRSCNLQNYTFHLNYLQSHLQYFKTHPSQWDVTPGSFLIGGLVIETMEGQGITVFPPALCWSNEVCCTQTGCWVFQTQVPWSSQCSEVPTSYFDITL